MQVSATTRFRKSLQDAKEKLRKKLQITPEPHSRSQQFERTLTLGTLRYAALLGSYVGVRGVTPGTAGIIVGIPTKVLPQVISWVPVGIKPADEETNAVHREC